jgi:hypothetical protein
VAVYPKNKSQIKTHFLIQTRKLNFVQILKMEQQKKHKGLYWLLFLVSAAALVFAIVDHHTWLTLTLPFVATSFVKALDIV